MWSSPARLDRGITLTPGMACLPFPSTHLPTLAELDLPMPPKKLNPSNADSVALDALVRVMDLESLEHNLYRGQTQHQSWPRLYGGMVLAQALAASIRTVEPDRHAHSMHGYFLLGGDPGHPILYEVERVRDGSSFTTRRVKAIQHGRPIFVLSVSFQKEEEGFWHQTRMPDVPPPENVRSIKELLEDFGDGLPANVRSFWQRDRPFEMRPVDTSRYVTRAKSEPKQNIWIRANGKLGDDQNLHRCLLAYASDFTLLDTALIAHGKLLFDTDIQLASIDHAMWLHRPLRVDEWLLYSQESTFAGSARGFCRGSIYSRDGSLVASVTQEGLIRMRSP
jgi:acyl-CoA thioesterase-2